MSDIREFTRHEATHLIDYLLIDEYGQTGTYSMGRTLDVSEQGLQLETIAPLSPKSIIQISITLDEDLVDLRGRVVHCRSHRGRYLSGITFQPIDSNSAQIISRYVKSFHRKKKQYPEM